MATLEFEDPQLIALSVALAGKTVAVILFVSLLFKFKDEGESSTPVTSIVFTGALATLTIQSAEALKSPEYIKRF